jgi:hypothetical protein
LPGTNTLAYQKILKLRKKKVFTTFAEIFHLFKKLINQQREEEQESNGQIFWQQK